MHKNNIYQNRSKEFTFQDIVNILKEYKWSIIFMSILAGFLSYAYVHFKPALYHSYAIIKVKPNEKNKSDDLINKANSATISKNVIEEISLLKTFKINKEALEKIHFKVQYFVDDNYKKKEIYNNIPIKVLDIKILDKSVIGKKIKLIPKENGYSLTYINSYQEKIQHILFKTKLFSLKTDTVYPYNETIENDFFHLTIQKNTNLKEPIYFTIYENNRQIFENFIKNRLEITQLEKDTSLIKIQYQDTIPDRAENYVNALTKSFISYSISMKNQQNNKTLNYISTELIDIKKELKESEETLEKHQVSKSFVKPSVQASIYIRDLSKIEIQISENNLKKKLILNLIDFVQHNYNLDAIAPSISKLKDNNTLRLIGKLQDQQLLEEELSIEFTEEYPKLKSIKKQIDNLKEKIEFNLKSLKRNIDYQNKSLIERKANYESNLKTLPSQERELINIKRNYEVKSKMYEYLLKKKAENKIIQLATFSDYQIIDYAYNSNKPIKTKNTLIIFLGLMLGFIVASILAFIRHVRNGDIQSKEDIEKLTNLPIYGTIPFQKQKKNEIHVHQEVKSPFSEAYRTLRTNLQFMNKSTKGNIILLTSTVPGEGKSTTAANLSTILEMAKYKTLVINFDLRKPSLHKFFDIPNDKGVSSYLSGKDSIEEITCATEFANLNIIPSGPIPIDPSELMLSKRLPSLFEKVREEYDYIIIDTAPIGIISDTKTLIPFCDINLIIVREDYAKKEFIFTLEEIVEKHDFKNVGLILNASKAQGGEYGYGYSYEYKYK